MQSTLNMPRYERPTDGASVTTWSSASERMNAAFPPLPQPYFHVGRHLIPNIGWPYLLLRAVSWMMPVWAIVTYPFIVFAGGAPIWLFALIPWFFANFVYCEVQYHKRVRKSHGQWLNRMYQRTAALERWDEVWNEIYADTEDSILAETEADRRMIPSGVLIAPRDTNFVSVGSAWTDMILEKQKEGLVIPGGFARAQAKELEKLAKQAKARQQYANQAFASDKSFRCTKCGDFGYVHRQAGKVVCSCPECSHEAHVYDVLAKNKQALAKSKADRAAREKKVEAVKMAYGKKHGVYYAKKDLYDDYLA